MTQDEADQGAMLDHRIPTETAPGADSTAAVGHPGTFRPCRFCGVAVAQPKRRDIVKDFCSDRHRAAFRDQQVQHAIRTALAAIQEAAGEFERLVSRLDGAAGLLERYQRKPRKDRPPKAPAEPSKALTDALGVLLGKK